MCMYYDYIFYEDLAKCFLFFERKTKQKHLKYLIQRE